MKTEDLIRVLRKLIKEEVQKTVAEEVNKSMTRLLAEVISNRSSKNTEKSYIGQQIDHEPEAPPQKHYVKNSKLNEALNSTVPDLRQRDAAVGLPTEKVSLSEMFEKVSSPEEIYSTPRTEPVFDTSTKIGMLKSIVNREPVMQQTSVLDTPNPLDKVFKKDFRSLMRKMDEQKEKGSSGIFSGVIPTIPSVGGFDQS